jgi:Kdo2-lipid IVA lauroyltransferase/acyltransferase
MGSLRHIRHSLELPAAKLLTATSRLLPGPISWILAGIAGSVAAAVPSRASKIFDINRRHVMEPNGLDVRPRAVYRHLLAGMTDFLRMTNRSDVELSRLVTVTGGEHMASALSEGKGAIALTAHYSAWELIPRAVALLGHRVGIISRRLSDPATSGYLDRLRAAPGTVVIDRGAGIGRLMRCLRENTAVGILIDQDTLGVESGFVDFLGLPARTPVGPARIALRFGIPVVPLHIRRVEGGRYSLVIEPPLDLSGFSGEDGYLELTAEVTRRIGEWIREDPEQWIWMHERWARRPGGTPGLR